MSEPSGPWATSGRKKASDLALASDGDLIEAASEWTQHTPFEMELQRRLTVALLAFKASNDRSSRLLVILTVVLVVLTVAIAALTLVLVVNPPT